MNKDIHSCVKPIVRAARIALAASVLCSCARSETEFAILPPPTYPLSREAIGYGVIAPSYINLSNAPEEGGLSHGYLRRSSVVKVLERKLVNKGTENSPSTPEAWVFVEGGYQGWLYEELVDVYDYEEQAKTAAEKIAQ
jgi:hypothetical protein